MLAIMNGEVDYKAQGLGLTEYPTLKENEATGKYGIRMPAGSIGPAMAFNITHNDPKLRAVYSDLRFRQAISHAINREEINDVLYFGLGKPSQALPAQISVRHRSRRQLHDRLRRGQGQRAARRHGHEEGLGRHAHLSRRLALHDPVGVFDPVRHAGVRQAGDATSSRRSA